MLRKAFILAVAAASVAAPAHAQERVLLMPRVSYEKQVEFTSHGPVAIHVVTAPRPVGLWSLKPVLSNGAVVATERLTAMQTALGTQATVVGVNGDFYDEQDGRPQGIVLQSGVLGHPPHGDRSSIGIGTDGTLRVDRVRMFGTWRGTQRRPLGLNHVAGANGTSLFTPLRGPVTPAVAGGVAAIIPALPATVPNVELTGTVSELRPATAAIGIPPGGAVLIARGTAAQRLQAEVAPGTNVTVRFIVAPDWSGVPDALGGGPVLVRGGKPVFRHGELFSTAQLGRNPRAAVGQLADGRIVLVAVDGGQRGYSVGMTNFELARTLVRLGAVTGAGLGVGPQAAMAFEGRLLNRPSAPGGERAVTEGLFVLYRGVYAAPPSEPVVSPNGDDVAESTDLAYKVVRPGRVTVTVVGPDRATRQLDVAEKVPGVYRLVWNGRTAGGEPEPEGRWRFVVTAVDEQGQATTAERAFSVNRTLAALSVARSGSRVHARFTLARTARVVVTLETPSGAVLAVAARSTLAAGTRTVSWARSRVRSGRYVVRVAADNAIGHVELTAPGR